MTNIAIAFKHVSGVKAKRSVISGLWAALPRRKYDAQAEFNICGSGGCKAGNRFRIPMTMVGLDVTLKGRLKTEDEQEIRALEIRELSWPPISWII